jgi:hypothetical protein
VPEPRRTAWFCSVCHPYDGLSRDFAVIKFERLARANAALKQVRAVGFEEELDAVQEVLGDKAA